MSATSPDQVSPVHAGLARIAGQAAAITAEANRLFSLPLADTENHASMGAILNEMRSMAQLLAQSRSEIIAMTPAPSGSPGLQQAGDTLDIVVGETERATFEIMHQAERAQAAAARLHAGTSTEIGADLAEVNEAATAIVLACIFQDVTGQRIRKVMSALREIERRISSLVALMGISDAEMAAGNPVPVEPQLLNGPSSAAEGGLGQCAVDDLFA